MNKSLVGPHVSLHGIADNEEAFRLLVDRVQDYSICLLDACGLISSWNSGAERMYGYSAAEIVGQPFETLFPPEAQSSARAALELEGAIRQGHVEGEGRRARKDGSSFSAHVVLNALFDEKQVLRGYAQITRDITLRQRMEDRFRRVVQEAPSAMIMINPEGRIVLFNRQAEITFGYTQQEMLEQMMEVLVPERFRKAHPVLRSGFSSQPAARPMGFGRDLYGLHKNGNEFPVEIGLNPIETEEGAMVLAAIVDITSRKSAQQQIETSLKEKTVLLNEIHHRVKNNLQVIISLLNMEANYQPAGDAKNVLLDSQARVRSMALIHQLLYERHDFSRVDMGEYLQRFSPLLLSSFGSLAGKITLSLEAEVHQVYMELQRATPCGLLISELVSNVFKHAYPQQSGTVCIKLSLLGRGEALLVIADQGIGLPSAETMENTKTLGLQLIPILVDQIGATLCTYDNHPGVRYEMRFPVMEEESPP